jgi:hypothetical protein
MIYYAAPKRMNAEEVGQSTWDFVHGKASFGRRYSQSPETP